MNDLIFKGTVYWVYDNGWYHIYCPKPENDRLMITDETKLESATISKTIFPNAITIQGLETYKNGIERTKPKNRNIIINGNFAIHF